MSCSLPDVSFGLIHFTGLRIGTDFGVNQQAFVIVIGVPIIARQFLVIPIELAGLDIERDGGIAEQIDGRFDRHGIGRAVPRQPRIGIGIGDAPIQHLALRIVGADLPPWPRRALVHRQVRPSVAARFARRSGREEFPHQSAGLGVIGCNEAVFALGLLAGAVGNHLAVGNQKAAGLLASIVEFGSQRCFPVLASIATRKPSGAAKKIMSS
jgi:hypothetical protein